MSTLNTTNIKHPSSASNNIVLDSSARVLVGTSSVISNNYGGTAGRLQVANNDYLPIGFFTYSNTAGETGFCPYLELNRARGTQASPSAVGSGDDLGLINFYGHDGATFIRSALIKAVVDGTPGANDMPGRLVFSTTPDSGSSPVERMRLTSDGYMRLGDGTTYYHTIRGAGGNEALEFTANAGQQSATTAGTIKFLNSDSGGAITERMRITNTGRTELVSATDGFIVGTTAAAGTSTELFRGAHSSTAGSQNTGTISIRIYNNGNIQNTNGSYTTLSDAKLKENIVDAGSQWDDLKVIQIRNWNFKAETGHETHRQIGPIAQELEAVCPGLVFETPDRDEDGNETGEVTKGVNQSVLYMKAVKALQEAMERIETLEAKVAALETA
jgi:hypothetical protein